MLTTDVLHLVDIVKVQNLIGKGFIVGLDLDNQGRENDETYCEKLHRENWQ
jgi:hypothetical protein